MMPLCKNCKHCTVEFQNSKVIFRCNSKHEETSKGRTCAEHQWASERKIADMELMGE
jgi:hypothetical protein